MRSQGFFDLLSSEAAHYLRERSRVVEVRLGEPLILADGWPLGVFIIRQGWAKETLGSADGTQQVLLRVYGPGDLIGADVALSRRTPPPTRVLPVVTVSAFKCSITAFENLMEMYYDARYAVNGLLVDMLRDADRRSLASATPASAEKNLATVIWSLLGRADNGEATELALPARLTQAELGSLAGVSRQTTTRVLKEWREQGAVTTGYRRLTFHLAAFRKATDSYLTQ